MQSIIAQWHDLRIYVLVGVLLFLGLIRLWSTYRKRKQQIASSHSLVDRDNSAHKLLGSETLVTSGLDVAPRVLRNPPKRIVGSRPLKARSHSSLPTTSGSSKIQPIIFYCSLSGYTEKAASDLSESYSKSISASNSEDILKPLLLDLSYIEYDDYFAALPKSLQQPDASVQFFYIILIPTYNVDTIITNFLDHLNETHHDFRVDTAPLSGLAGYAVFGFGDAVGWPTEQDGFCVQAIEADKWLAKLSGRRRAYPVGMADVNSEAIQTLKKWASGVFTIMEDFAAGKGLGEGVPGSGDALESDDEEEDQGTDSGRRSRRKRPAGIEDLENVGASLSQSGSRAPTNIIPIDFTTPRIAKTAEPAAPKEMVPKASPTYNALTKQGYTIVGSHSGVKICRWTKSALRGRGSCYKFSFYGIKSHLCMETTPSLSCSNKCVFCWRHGTNPVSTHWRWQVDPPDLIFEGVKKGHYAKIKMMRGVPGVRAERFEEAMQIRHCALSLVGEPIFYPHINEFTAMLHKERISSFLVCNAQHPDQLATLKRVTQLYVSIDASNRESLRKIDRPLHRDFWERFCRCMDILREKRFQQRTVFRLTLVKGFNIEDEVEGYANLVERGLPCFVEIKGVTYCGTSTSAGAGLTMKNVPFYEEVSEFVLSLNAALERRGLEYGIAAEHAHSCCVLIASKRFLSDDGQWRTVIDYDKFFELLESGKEFSPEEYTAATSTWALWGNGGFDPADERVKRKPKKESTIQSW